MTEKCAMLIVNSGKRETTEAIEQSKHQKSIRTLGEKEYFKSLRILEVNTIKQAMMKGTIRKDNFRRMTKLLENKLCSRNLIKGISIWAVLLVKDSGPFFK